MFERLIGLSRLTESSAKPAAIQRVRRRIENVQRHWPDEKPRLPRHHAPSKFDVRFVWRTARPPSRTSRCSPAARRRERTRARASRREHTHGRAARR